MALVDLLPGPGDVDSRLLDKARLPGRMRDTAARLLDAALADPRGADGIFRHGLRDARYLHSRERRLVADGLHAIVAHRRVLDGHDGATLWHAWIRALAGEPVPPTDDPARLMGVPDDVAPLLVASLGDGWADFIADSLGRAPVTLRVNRRWGTRDQLARELRSGGIETEPGRYAPDALHVLGRPNLRGHRLARTGAFEVQDEASQLCVELVGGGSVIDWCAGAGGKSLGLASRWGADVLAADIRGGALATLRQRASRAGVRIPTGVHGNGPADIVRERGPVDTVLVDAPCSGTGVWRRHPTHRLSLTLARLAELGAAQASVLGDAAAFVRPGGRLVYATCSVLRVENDDVVHAFLAARDDFELEPVQGVPADGPFLRLLPHVHGTDGFFAAVLRKRSA